MVVGAAEVLAAACSWHREKKACERGSDDGAVDAWPDVSPGELREQDERFVVRAHSWRARWFIRTSKTATERQLQPPAWRIAAVGGWPELALPGCGRARGTGGFALHLRNSRRYARTREKGAHGTTREFSGGGIADGLQPREDHSER